MSKQSVTQWWIGGLLAYVPAGILIPAAIVALIAHLDELRAGTDLHFVADAYSWTMWSPRFGPGFYGFTLLLGFPARRRELPAVCNIRV